MGPHLSRCLETLREARVRGGLGGGRMSQTVCAIPGVLNFVSVRTIKGGSSYVRSRTTELRSKAYAQAYAGACEDFNELGHARAIMNLRTDMMLRAAAHTDTHTHTYPHTHTQQQEVGRCVHIHTHRYTDIQYVVSCSTLCFPPAGARLRRARICILHGRF